MRTLAVVPVYNHGHTLRDVVERLLAQSLDVLVVDDGSTDDALGRLEGLHVFTLRIPENRGKGRAILAGAAFAREQNYDAMLTLDADGQHRPEEAQRLVDAAREHWPAFVVGVRQMEGPEVPQASKLGRRLSNFWGKVETGTVFGDTQSGFRLYPVSFLLAHRFVGSRYTFEVEVLVKAAWAHWRILEVPISVHYPASGRVSHFRAFMDNFRFTCLHTWLTCWAVLGLRRWR